MCAEAAAGPTGPAAMPTALARMTEQPRVRDFLAASLAEDRLSHAYLFVGAPGSGKEFAAEALAKCIVCPNGGCATCDECLRVAHRTHPDVRWLAPGGASGYLVQQARDLIADVPLTPSRAKAKVYVLERAELLRDAAANALLKTIEEPPQGVVFILCARSVSTVLPTIVSRCQVVPFRTVSPEAGVGLVMRETGATQAEARIALGVVGTPSKAIDYLKNDGRRDVRRLVVNTLDELPRDDSWDVLQAAGAILIAVNVPLKDMRKAMDEATNQNSDFLTAAALKQLKDANKRELTARERSGIMEALSAADSLLRDVLMRCEDVGGSITNSDVADVVDRLAASTTTAGAVAAIAAVSRASDDLARNVSPQLALETMLLRVKEALTCPPSYR